MHIASSRWLGSFGVDVYDLCFAHYITSPPTPQHTHTHSLSKCLCPSLAILFSGGSPLPAIKSNCLFTSLLFFHPKQFFPSSFFSSNWEFFQKLSEIIFACSLAVSVSFFCHGKQTHTSNLLLAWETWTLLPNICGGVDSVSKWTLAGGQSGQASDDVHLGDKGAKCEVFHKLSLGGERFCRIYFFLICSLSMTPPELKWTVILNLCRSVNQPFMMSQKWVQQLLADSE